MTGTAGTSGTTGTGGMTGTAGTMGTAGTGGTAGTTGTGGMAGGTGMAGRGGTTGAAGATAGTGGAAGTTGMAGRGGTTGTGGAAGTGGTGGMAGTIGTGMVVWYKFDETSGTTAADASGSAHNGTVAATGTPAAAFTATHQVGTGAINLMGSMTTGGYINLPASLNAMGATTAITVACWVNVSTARNWARVWDFNDSSTTGYIFLTTQEQTNGMVGFAITMTGNSGEQSISSAAKLATGWHHIAIVCGRRRNVHGDDVHRWCRRRLEHRDDPAAVEHRQHDEQLDRPVGVQHGPVLRRARRRLRVYNRALTASEITALYAVR